MHSLTDDLRIQSIRPLIPPALLIHELPVSDAVTETIAQTRRTTTHIIQKFDNRLLVIVGPCSIHDPEAALDYGRHLRKLIEKHKNELCIVMRVYFEKPRTIRGWKGLINDPNLDENFDINAGLRSARNLLLQLIDQGVPCATEFLDTIIPQFIGDLISWAAIGARTTESQVHRELASGLSMPVGFKNGTDGNIQIAIDAIRAAQYPHHFLSVTKSGMAAIVSTTGNDVCHIVLRGSNHGVNYNAENISNTCQQLRKFGLPEAVMVDCSHGNSFKNHTKQAIALRDITKQIANGANEIVGVMIESNLIAGKQDLTADKPLVYGQSITDACIGWEETVTLLDELAAGVKARRSQQP